MPARVVLVKIHGIGNQSSTWSRDFDQVLDQKLVSLPANQQAAVKNESVWWADLSVGPGNAAPSLVAAPSGSGSVPYHLAYQQYLQYAAGSDLVAAGLTGAPAGFDSMLDWGKNNFIRLKDSVISFADQANDVANYISDNAVRVKILNRLIDKLFAVHAENPEAVVILGSHSQGTIISLDALRLIGAQVPFVKVWVTMGCPLAWYLNAHWGSDQVDVPPTLTWDNWYDPDDRVGREIGPLINWASPVPKDDNVQNAAKFGLDPHDHWHNPDVVDRYFQIIQSLIG